MKYGKDRMKSNIRILIVNFKNRHLTALGSNSVKNNLNSIYFIKHISLGYKISQQDSIRFFKTLGINLLWWHITKTYEIYELN